MVLRQLLRQRQLALPVAQSMTVPLSQFFSSEMLGHAKASMTLDTYADLFDEDLDGVADRLDAAIQATAGRSADGF